MARGDMALSGQYLYWAVSGARFDWFLSSGIFDTVSDTDLAVDPFATQASSRKSSSYFLGKTTKYV
jgi:hypothetical protein